MWNKIRNFIGETVIDIGTWNDGPLRKYSLLVMKYVCLTLGKIERLFV